MHGNSKDEAKGRNTLIVVINRKERNLGTKEKSPKQSITSAKDLTVKLNEGRDSTYHRLDYI